MYARPMTRNDDYAALVGGHYGLPRRRRPARPATAGTVALSLSADTGAEVLEPSPPEAPLEEYVVDRPEPPAATAPAVDTAPPAESAPPVDTAPAPVPPLEPAPKAPAAAPPPVPEQARQRTSDPMPSRPPAAPPVTAPDAAPGGEKPVAAKPTTPDDDQLAADMEAILSGRKVYDPQTGGLRERGQAAPPPPPPPGPSPSDQHAIFDRIAASLEHSNTFDLGEVELRRRFDVFDRLEDQRHVEKATPAAASSAPVVAAVPASTGTAEFIHDLEAIDRNRPTPPATIAAYHQRGPWDSIPDWHAGCGASSLALTVAPERSTAMFDTGEHVLAAGDLYPDQLRVGSGQGVPFSYGQVIAMGDFFGSVAELKNAAPAELSRLKALITRNTEYYRDGRRDPSKDVSNSEWDSATGGRYLQLAETNYDHFSPAALTGMTAGREQDNRRRWEELHEQALNEASQLVLQHPNASPFLEGPLITNAFADHFLTDAFAAGHLINKESVIARFRSRFFSGGGLNDAARSFFSKVAERSYTGRVAERFSQLESSAPLCAYGYCVDLHPNIRHWRMFAEVLQQAAEAEPVRIANLAVKIIHDKLNRDGVEVVNDAGDPAWTATGDGSMNPTSLAIMRKAVQQSVDNLSDPSIQVSNLNPSGLQQKVWRYTPRPTSSGRAAITRAIEAYTDPNNAELVTATAALVTAQLDSLVRALIDSGKMREDP